MLLITKLTALSAVLIRFIFFVVLSVVFIITSRIPRSNYVLGGEECVKWVFIL